MDPSWRSNPKNLSELESLCVTNRTRALKKYLSSHIHDTNQSLKTNLPAALKLAKDPTKLVLDSIGKFYLNCNKIYNTKQQIASRLANVMILEAFVVISSDEGVEVGGDERELAEKSAKEWRKRMVKEGGKVEEVDARGLLLFVVGFGVAVGKGNGRGLRVEEFRDLIRCANVKGIAGVLRRSVSFIPKVPEVIDLMVKDNLEVEAADLAYTFGLEDKCHPETILTTFLHKKIMKNQNGSSIQGLTAMKQQLSDLKSVKACLESHDLDPSKLLPDFNINERMQHLEKEIAEEKRNVEKEITEQKTRGSKRNVEKEITEEKTREVKQTVEKKITEKKTRGRKRHPMSPPLTGTTDNLRGVNGNVPKARSRELEEKTIQKRKGIEAESLENGRHQEAKRAYYSHENGSGEQKPVDRYGTSPYNLSYISHEHVPHEQKLVDHYGTGPYSQLYNSHENEPREPKPVDPYAMSSYSRLYNSHENEPRDLKPVDPYAMSPYNRLYNSHENDPREQKPIDHYAMSYYNRSTQPSSSYVDFDRQHSNNYVTTYSAPSVYRASALPENIGSSVASGLAGPYGTSVSGRSITDQLVHTVDSALIEKYLGQPYSRQSLTYDSQPSLSGLYDRVPGQSTLEPFPAFPDSSISGGIPVTRVPAKDLYGFADTVVERDTHGSHASGSRKSRSSYLH